MMGSTEKLSYAVSLAFPVENCTLAWRKKGTPAPQLTNKSNETLQIWIQVEKFNFKTITREKDKLPGWAPPFSYINSKRINQSSSRHSYKKGHFYHVYFFMMWIFFLVFCFFLKWEQMKAYTASTICSPLSWCTFLLIMATVKSKLD